jgi:hypothetical protein
METIALTVRGELDLKNSARLAFEKENEKEHPGEDINADE